MANSWSKQPIWQGGFLNSVNDAVVGGQLTTVPVGVAASQGEQTLPGDHLVLDEAAAFGASNKTVGTLHGGYFQYVQLDPTIATVGAISGVVAVGGAGGTGYSAATTTVTFAAAPAGGTTATGVAVVNAAGVITAIQVTNQGAGYLAAPAVTITSTSGGSGATGTATLQAVSPIALGQALFWKNAGNSSGVYTVTNVESGNLPLFAGVVINPAWNAGNYAWIQVLGRATVLSSGAIVAAGGVSLAAAGAGASNATFIPVSATLANFVGVAESIIATGTTGIVDIQKATLRF